MFATGVLSFLVVVALLLQQHAEAIRSVSNVVEFDEFDVGTRLRNLTLGSTTVHISSPSPNVVTVIRETSNGVKGIALRSNRRGRLLFRFSKLVSFQSIHVSNLGPNKRFTCVARCGPRGKRSLCGRASIRGTADAQDQLELLVDNVRMIQCFVPKAVVITKLELETTEPCVIGEEQNNEGTCIPVTCASPQACTSDPNLSECLDTANDCGATEEPCPQFTCVAPCGVGEERDTLTNECVAVSCESPNACSADEVCREEAISCIRSPCPQFTCEQPCGVGEERDTRTNECVAVSCESPTACPANQGCREATINCFVSPCPQFMCEQCPVILCRLFCPDGFQRDDIGCEICQCAP